MFKVGDIAFGDNVQVLDTDETRLSGHASLVGVCFGMTTPTVTGVDVVGNPTGDVALNVHFDSDRIPDAWFAPHLVMLLDHAVGSVATIGDHSFVKGPNGEWLPAGQEGDLRPRPRRWFTRG